MRKAIYVAGTVFRLLFRNGTGWGVLGLTALAAGFMFFFARSDGAMINELRIRSRYALYCSSGLLTLAMMYVACSGLRNELDYRQFHALTAAPARRAWLWVGKLLGYWVFAALAFVWIGAVIAGCGGVFLAFRGVPEKERASLKQDLFRAFYRQSPTFAALDAKVETALEERRSRGPVDTAIPLWKVRKDIYNALRKKEQTVGPGETRKWTFDLDPSSGQGDFLILRFKFYAEKRGAKIQGRWTLSSPVSAGEWAAPVDAYPFMSNSIQAPRRMLPKKGPLTLAFENRSDEYAIFPLSDGVTLLYDNGNIFKNFVYLCAVMFCHLAVLIALALALAAMFSYSVAVFIGLAMYCAGAASGFFVTVIRDLQYDERGGLTDILLLVLKFGVWLTQGARTPPAIEYFSEGVSVPLASIAAQWGPGFLLYLVIAVAVGTIVLTRKELDKIMGAS